MANTKQANKQSRCAFLKCCIGTFDTEFYSPVLPRLCFVCFKFSQPIFLYHIIAYIGGQGGSLSVQIALIMTSLLIFLGIAVGFFPSFRFQSSLFLCSSTSFYFVLCRNRQRIPLANTLNSCRAPSTTT